MGTVVVDRIIDVISILLVTALAIALEYDTILAFAKQHVSVADKIALLQKMILWGIPLMLLGFERCGTSANHCWRPASGKKSRTWHKVFGKASKRFANWSAPGCLYSTAF